MLLCQTLVSNAAQFPYMHTVLDVSVSFSWRMAVCLVLSMTRGSFLPTVPSTWWVCMLWGRLWGQRQCQSVNPFCAAHFLSSLCWRRLQMCPESVHHRDLSGYRENSTCRQQGPSAVREISGFRVLPILGNLCWTRWPPEVPPNPSVILSTITIYKSQVFSFPWAVTHCLGNSGMWQISSVLLPPCGNNWESPEVGSTREYIFVLRR